MDPWNLCVIVPPPFFENAIVVRPNLAIMEKEDHFASIEDIRKYITKLKGQFHPLRVGESHTVESYNKKLRDPKNKLSADIGFKDITYVCKHYGQYRNRGSGIRSLHHVLPSNCEFKIRFSYNKCMKRFVMTSHNLHNHDIGANIYKQYMENRKLNDNDKKEVCAMLDVGAKPSLIRNLMQAKTSKFILTKDILNAKNNFKSTKTEIEDLVQYGNDFLRANPGSEFTLYLDAEGKFVEMVYIQSLFQKKIYKAFGEVLELDATYRISNTCMPLFDFVVEDSEGKSVVVAYCFVSSEGKEIITQMLQLFRKCNLNSDQTKVILIDKDFSEISAISEAFPDARIHLCVFHMLKAINNKLNSLHPPDDVKQLVKSICKKIIYTTSVEIFDDCLMKFKEVLEPFHKYFVDNWMSCKESWSSLHQKGVMTLMNSTTNRVEAHHRILKQHLSASKTICDAIKILCNLSSTALVEITHREFTQKFLTTVVTNISKDIQEYLNFCSTYAAELISVEYSTSLHKHYDVVKENGLINVITPYNIHQIQNYNKCSCEINVRLKLPCRHLFYVRKQMNLPTFDFDLVSNRFRKGYYSEVLGDYNTSIPVGQNSTNVQAGLSLHSKKLTRQQKFAEIAGLVQQIAVATSELPDKDYQRTKGSLNYFLDCILNRKSITMSFAEDQNSFSIVEDTYTDSVSTEILHDTLSNAEPQLQCPSMDPLSCPSGDNLSHTEISTPSHTENDTISHTHNATPLAANTMNQLLGVKIRRLKRKGRPSQQRIAHTFLQKRKRMKERKAPSTPTLVYLSKMLEV